MSQPPAKDNKQSQTAKSKNAKKDTKKPEPKKEEIKVVEPPKVLTADELQALLVAGNSKDFSPSAIPTKKFVISD